ncbi:hypothetical protein ES705_29218 [subsurface metagenome]
MKIHHFGFLTENLQKSIIDFRKLGYTEIKRSSDNNREIEIAFIESVSGEILELIMPISSTSVVSKIIKNFKNNIYHICYLTSNINNSIKRLEQNGFFLIDKPKPAILFDNRNIAFMYSKYAGMVELLEE